MTPDQVDRWRGTRFAHLIESDGPGGAERMLASVAAALQAAGAYNIVVAPAAGEGWLARELRGTGVQIELFRLDRPVSPSMARWLTEVLRRHRVALAHSHEFTMAVYGAWAARRAGIPHLITMHGGRYYADRLQRRVALHLAARSSSALVAVSQTLGRHLARDLWLGASKIVTIPNGVRVAARSGAPSSLRDELRLSPADQLALAVGNLYPVKGHRVLLDALGLLADQYPRLHVAIAGRGELENALRQRAAELGLQDRFHLLGLRADIGDLLAAADLFIQPSLSEGVPLALLEAMLAERPVIASAVGEVPTVLDGGRAGVLVPPADASALAERMAELLAQRARANALAAAGRARAAAAYTFDVMLEAYLARYARALGNHPHDAGTERVRDGERQPLPQERPPGKRALVR